MRNVQGKKDAEYEWYQLLFKIFDLLGMIMNTTCKRIFTWLKDGHGSITILAIYAMLFATSRAGMLDILLAKFDI